MLDSYCSTACPCFGNQLGKTPGFVSSKVAGSLTGKCMRKLGFGLVFVVCGCPVLRCLFRDNLQGEIEFGELNRPRSKSSIFTLVIIYLKK